MSNRYTKETKEGLTLESSVKRYGNFIKSTCTPLSMKDKKQLSKATVQLFYGINQKKDNINKTKQLPLF